MARADLTYLENFLLILQIQPPNGSNIYEKMAKSDVGLLSLAVLQMFITGT